MPDTHKIVSKGEIYIYIFFKLNYRSSVVKKNFC